MPSTWPAPRDRVRNSDVAEEIKVAEMVVQDLAAHATAVDPSMKARGTAVDPVMTAADPVDRAMAAVLVDRVDPATGALAEADLDRTAPARAPASAVDRTTEAAAQPT